VEGLFFSAIGLGLAYNAAPGAVNTECVRRGLSRGFRPALLVQLGALIGDSSWAVVALSGATVLVRNPSLRVVLGGAGAAFLLWLACGALLDAWRGSSLEGREVSSRGDFASGAFFSLANPFAVAFWLGIGSGLAATSSTSPGVSSLSLLFGGFVLGAFSWCLAASALVGWGQRFVTPALIRLVNLLCGVALAYFGVSLFWNVLHLARP
jgi:chemosensory pili system protein ChpE